MTFWTLFIVAQFGLFVKGEPSLQIFKSISGTDIPIAYTFREVAGTNFTLKCKLLGADNDTSNYFDDQLSWGWKRKNVQFSNIVDLKKLADDEISNPLKQFLNHSGNANEATLPLQPLLSLDSGKFFCMSLKYKLFNIIKIRVIRNSKYEFDNKINFDILEDNTPQAFNKSSCNTNMFMCNSRKLCIHEEHVCDNIKDCTDGSDENYYLCGMDTCKDKTSCSNGRCLSESVCCDYTTNFTCSSTQPSCCSEIITKSNTQYFNGFISNQFNAPALNFPSFEIATLPNYDLNQFQNEENNWINPHVDDLLKEDNSRQPTTTVDHYRRRGYIWVVMVPVIIIMILLRICLRGEVEKCRNGSRRELLLWRISTLTVVVANNQEGSSSPNNSTTEEQTHTMNDLPPSYDEAVVNVPQNASLLK